MVYQLAAAGRNGSRYVVVALAVSNPFLFDNLRGLLLHWGVSESLTSHWGQPPKGWHTSPSISTVRAGAPPGAGWPASNRRMGPQLPGFACMLPLCLHSSTLLQLACDDSTAHPSTSPARLLLQPAGDRAWQTVLGAFAPVVSGDAVPDAALYSVVLQIPLEGGCWRWWRLVFAAGRIWCMVELRATFSAWMVAATLCAMHAPVQQQQPARALTPPLLLPCWWVLLQPGSSQCRCSSLGAGCCCRHHGTAGRHQVCAEAH